MQQITTAQILYIKPRQDTLVEGEIKGAFEYDGGHGAACFFVCAAFDQSLFQTEELQAVSKVDTVKFLQQEQQWHVIFSNEDMSQSCVCCISNEDMQQVCKINHINLVHV